MSASAVVTNGTTVEQLQATFARLHKKADFASSVADRIEIVEVETSQDRREVTVVCEMVVVEDMANSAGAVHGGCVCYLIDMCTSLPVLAIMNEEYWWFGGVSQSMHIAFHAGARIGAKLRIKSTILNMGKRISNLRCEIRDADTDVLYYSGTHSKVDIFTSIASKAGHDKRDRLSDFAGGSSKL